MEYTGYTPDEVKKDKRKNMLLICLVSLFLAVSAIITIVGVVSLFEKPQADEITDVSSDELKTGNAYHFEEMIVVDQYAHLEEDNKITKRDYLVLFEMADGEVVFAGLRANAGGELDQKCYDYSEDTGSLVGDLVIDGYFKAYKAGSTNSSYYDEACEIYGEEIGAEKLNWYFTYEDAKTAEEFAKNQKSDNTVMLIVGGVMLIGAIAAMLAVIKKRKELNDYLEDYENEVGRGSEYRL